MVTKCMKGLSIQLAIFSNFNNFHLLIFKSSQTTFLNPRMHKKVNDLILFFNCVVNAIYMLFISHSSGFILFTRHEILFKFNFALWRYQQATYWYNEVNWPHNQTHIMKWLSATLSSKAVIYSQFPLHREWVLGNLISCNYMSAITHWLLTCSLDRYRLELTRVQVRLLKAWLANQNRKITPFWR